MRINPWALLLVAISFAGCEPITEAISCASPQAYSPGATATGRIEATDCKTGDTYLDLYLLSVTTQGGVVFTLSGGLSGGMSIFAGVSAPTATSNNTIDDTKEILSVDKGQSAKGYFPPGTYLMAVGSEGSGDYSLTSQSAHSNECSQNFTYPGASIGAAITDLDCPGASGSRYDDYRVQLRSGQRISVTATLLKPGAVVFRKLTASGDLVTRPMDAPNGGSTTFTYTATSQGWYAIIVFGEPGRFGAGGYSLQID